MFDAKQAPPPCIYLLGDHLDAILAAGEDLMATRLILAPPTVGGGVVELEARQTALASFISRLRTLEAALVARVLQARRRAEEVPRPDAHMKPLISLFLSGTAILLDAVEEYGDPSGIAFHAGADGFYFLRDRGLIAPDAASLPVGGSLAADDSYVIVGRVSLGPLMDLTSTFLDALDMRFSLYDDEIEDHPERPDPSAAAAALVARRTAAERDAVAASRPQLVAEALDALYRPR